MKLTNYTIIALGLLFGIVLNASNSFACWGNRMGHHGTGPANTQMALTHEKQKEIQAVEKKYEADFATLQAALDRKEDEYRQARADEKTTVGTLNRLESEMADLEQQYSSLLDKANDDARQVVGSDYGPWFGCNYNGRNYENHHSNSMVNHMGPDHMHHRMANHLACDCCGW